MRLYAIGDIHGQLDLLKAAHQRIFDDGGPDAVIAHVGDLIDRGPDSRGVVDHLLRGQQVGRPWIVTRGNHDRFLTDIEMAEAANQAEPVELPRALLEPAAARRLRRRRRRLARQ